jgi:Family of unknown function (DUF5677)
MDEESSVLDLVEAYELYLRASFDELWNGISIEYDKLEAYSVIGGLLSRQVTLSIQMARSPNILNGHSAPLFLRAMTDLHIALSWIMLDLQERSKKYILHGLGEEKLLMEHYKKEIDDYPDSPNVDQINQLIDAKSTWINSHRRDFFVEVNLGNWAQLDYRKMSQEADCEGLYKFAYKPFSHAAHNMWPHVSVYNCKYCQTPLHKHHLIPELFEAPIDGDFLFRSCKYVHMAYELFVDKFELTLEHPMPLDWWYDYFDGENGRLERE